MSAAAKLPPRLPKRLWRDLLRELVDAARDVGARRRAGDVGLVRRAERWADNRACAARALLRAYGGHVGRYPRGPWHVFGRREE